MGPLKASSSRQRIGTLLREVMKILQDNPEGVKPKSVLSELRQIVPPTEFERGAYKDGSSIYDKVVRFATLGPKRAG